VVANNVAMFSLCLVLSNQLDRHVVDKTGRTKHYDFKLEWAPENLQQGSDVAHVLLRAASRLIGMPGGARRMASRRVGTRRAPQRLTQRRQRLFEIGQQVAPVFHAYRDAHQAVGDAGFRQFLGRHAGVRGALGVARQRFHAA